MPGTPDLDTVIVKYLESRIGRAIADGSATGTAHLVAVVREAAAEAKADASAKGIEPKLARALGAMVAKRGAEMVADISIERARISPEATIAAELAALGVSDLAAGNIARNTIARYLRHAAEVHNSGGQVSTPDAPPTDLPDRVADEDRCTAMTITLALTRLTRATGGPCCPDTVLPMAYAAEAVLSARRTAAHGPLTRPTPITLGANGGAA